MVEGAPVVVNQPPICRMSCAKRYAVCCTNLPEDFIATWGVRPVTAEEYLQAVQESQQTELIESSVVTQILEEHPQDAERLLEHLQFDFGPCVVAKHLEDIVDEMIIDKRTKIQVGRDQVYLCDARQFKRSWAANIADDVMAKVDSREARNQIGKSLKLSLIVRLQEERVYKKQLFRQKYKQVPSKLVELMVKPPTSMSLKALKTEGRMADSISMHDKLDFLYSMREEKFMRLVVAFNYIKHSYGNLGRGPSVRYDTYALNFITGVADGRVFLLPFASERDVPVTFQTQYIDNSVQIENTETSNSGGKGAGSNLLGGLISSGVGAAFMAMGSPSDFGVGDMIASQVSSKLN
mmetsp:Transcript_45868/g.178196  ORF Transcript_45868/g.178196 Transcript_45868/m.178196 type:complete len:351 (-) Transcript_45868:251-1303(-)